MSRTVIIAFLVFILPAMAAAQAYRAINDLVVIPLGGDRFEVIEARGEGPRGMWCAAAEYAERRLGAKGRVYILGARGPARSIAGRKSAVFTLNPALLPVEPYQSATLGLDQVGMGLPIAHAIQFCRDIYDRDDDLLFRRFD